jgi:thymidylate kinase
MARGKFIVIYSPNNLGKSTQLELLKTRLQGAYGQYEFIKYPRYDLNPTGPLINAILRHPETLDKEYSEAELQALFAQNRRDYQKELEHMLDSGITVIAEDYKGTGIAWGLTRDVPLEELEEMNSGLLEPDLSILLDGTRFLEGIENGTHRNESAEQSLWEKNRSKHLFLSKKFGWKIVNANQPPKMVHKDIFKLIEPLIY